MNIAREGKRAKDWTLGTLIFRDNEQGKALLRENKK